MNWILYHTSDAGILRRLSALECRAESIARCEGKVLRCIAIGPCRMVLVSEAMSVRGSCRLSLRLAQFFLAHALTWPWALLWVLLLRMS
jgi:hypothetical protein